MMFDCQIEFLNENDTTRPATQVGLRTVEAGLGGHDAGASGVEEGVESASLPLSKRGRLTMSDRPTFSVFCGQVNDFFSENKTTETFLPLARCPHHGGCFTSRLAAVEIHESLDSVFFSGVSSITHYEKGNVQEVIE